MELTYSTYFYGMKKILSSLFFLILGFQVSMAQVWTRMQGWGLDLESIHWISDQKAVVVGENLIIYSQNGGTTWSEVLEKFDTRFYDVAFVNESTGVAVGEQGNIYRTTNGGIAWSKIASGTQKNLKSVIKISETQLLIAGEDGTLLRSADAGVTWTTINTGTTLDFNEIFFLNENLGFIAAEAGAIFKTTDRGTTWTKIQLPTSRALHVVLFTGEQIGYTAGEQGTFYRTTDGGTTWILSTTNTTSTLRKMAASSIDPRIIVAVGNQAVMIRSTNSAATFTTVNLGAGNTRNLLNLSFRPGLNELFTIGQNGYLIFSTNAGANWTTRQAGVRNDFSAVDFKSNTTGFISGKGGAFFVTTNGATSLISRPLPEAIDIHTIDFWNTSFGYASSGSGKMYRTGNSGSNWVAVPSQTPNKITGFYLFAPSVLYITGTNGYISRSFDSGVTWDQTIVSNTQTDFSDLMYFDFAFGVAVGKNGLLSRTFGGSVWQNQPKLTEENLNAIAKLDTTTAVAVGNQGVILKTTDKALTWQKLPFPEKVNLLSVDFWDLNLGFVSGENGVTFQTSDGGTTWVKIPSGTLRDLQSINYGNPNSAFAVGKDGTILSYSCTPPGNVSAITGNSTDCLGNSVYSITSQPEAGSEIVWRVDGGNIISGQGSSTIEVQWTEVGRNAVLVSRSNFCGSGETSAREVFVSKIPTITEPIIGQGTVCRDIPNTYSIPNQTGVTFTWDIQGGEIVSGQGTNSVNVLWKTEGDQKITVSPSNSCGKGEIYSKTIKVNKAPEQPAIIQGETVAALSVYRYETTPIPGLNYRWTVSGGGRILSGQGTASISVEWETEGNFELNVEAQNECEFGPKRTLTVNVNVITGLEPNLVEKDLRVFPNPSTGNFTVESSSLDVFSELRVVNSLGQVLFSSIIRQGEKSLGVFDLPRGVLYLQLIGKNGAVSRKVIVR